MESRGPRRSAKPLGKGPSAQERRREAALQRQRKARRDVFSRARDLVSAHGESSRGGRQDEGGTQQQQQQQSGGNWKMVGRQERVRERRRYWATQLTSPEWMTDVPEGLAGEGSAVGAGWFVRARPEGKRCLLIAHAANTVRVWTGGPGGFCFFFYFILFYFLLFNGMPPPPLFF
mmetsp:Transcript_61249/g.138625  ORF Transcript_61249/g.138625 Transcript_61249/m.138625 type:complete len:175 (+) Transcript_61249:123-647(+)